MEVCITSRVDRTDYSGHCYDAAATDEIYERDLVWHAIVSGGLTQHDERALIEVVARAEVRRHEACLR